MNTIRRFFIALSLLACSAVPVLAQGRNAARLAFTVSSQTCTSTGNGSAQALTVTTAGTSYVALTQSDPDGCTLTLGESAPKDGQVLVIVNISANSATINDSSGVQELTGGTTITLAQWAAATFIYRSDRWTQATPGGGTAPSGSITASGYTMTTARILGRTTASTGAIEELTSVPATLGGLGLTAICADDEAVVSNGTIYQCKAVPDCDNATTSKVLYDTATNTITCGTDQDNGSAASFNQTIQDEASDLTQQPKVNFTGAGVACVNNGGATRTDCTIPGGSGAVVQVVNTQTGAVATGTTTTPSDDTIPQSGEGTEFLTLAVTPTSATNKLKIEVSLMMASATAARYLTMALHQDATADALAATVNYFSATNTMHQISLVHYMTSGTTSATTFKVRVGANTASTLTFNGVAAARTYGGIAASSITITEIVP